MEPSNTKPQATHFFLHLGIIVTLYIAVGTFLAFAFDIINYAFPDRQAYGFDPYSAGMRFSISTLIVVFPLFVFLSLLAHKLLLADTAARNIPVRRWLSYLTLFIAGAVIAGDLVALVNTFLSGEIGARFISKVLLVLVVTGSVFWYILCDLRGAYFDKPKLLKLSMIAGGIIVLASIVGGFIIMGSPAKQRMLRDDMDRVNDLNTIQWNILSYYQRSGELPSRLDELKDDFNPGWYEDIYHDPVTKEPYSYYVVTGTTSITFDICAVFDLASEDLDGRGGYGRGWGMDYAISYPAYPGNFDQNFKHTEGRNCFTRTIDPDLYPVYKPEPVMR